MVSTNRPLEISASNSSYSQRLLLQPNWSFIWVYDHLPNSSCSLEVQTPTPTKPEHRNLFSALHSLLPHVHRNFNEKRHKEDKLAEPGNMDPYWCVRRKHKDNDLEFSFAETKPVWEVKESIRAVFQREEGVSYWLLRCDVKMLSWPDLQGFTQVNLISEKNTFNTKINKLEQHLLKSSLHQPCSFLQRQKR